MDDLAQELKNELSATSCWRDGLAPLHEASSDFVARINSWFDQTIDRVSQRFTHYTQWITMALVAVVLAAQLDIVAIADRVWIDDQFRNSIVADATKQFSQNNPNGKVDCDPPTIYSTT